MAEKIFCYSLDLPELSSWIEKEVEELLRNGFNREDVIEMVSSSVYSRLIQSIFEKLREYDNHIEKRIRETTEDILKEFLEVK